MKKRFFLSALAAVLLTGLLYAVDASADIVYGRQCPDVYYHNTGMYRSAETHYLYCYGCEAAKYEEPHTENHAPTCTEGSSCAVCGIAMREPIAHNFVQTQVLEATCYSPKTIISTCTGCKATEREKVGSPRAHQFGDYRLYTAATCDRDAVYRAKCTYSGCGTSDIITRPSTALGHSFPEENYISDGNATCEQDGTKTAKCIRFGSGGCRETHTVTIENSALGHDFLEEDYVPNGDAACERDGTKTAKCVRYGFGSCRETHTVTIENSALGHDFLEADYVPNGDAACERDGTKTAKCVRYGSGGCRETHTKTDTGSALTHLPVNDQGYPPTCTDTGLTDGSHCGREGCDKIFTPQASIAPTGHSYTAVVTPPTCTEDGYTTHTCAVCRHRYTSDITARLSHYYGEWTSQESGTHLAPCRRCGHRGTAACAALHYTLLAADTEDAYEFTLCPVCGEVSDGAQLKLIDQATAQPITRWLPAGEQVLRLGTLKNGELLLTAAFEISGQLTQPTGQVQFTLPAKHLEGFTLTILHPDGTEEPLDYTVAGKTATFTLDFTDQKAPAMALHLTPKA